MEFPVDLLETVDPEALEQSAKDYMSKLFYRNPGIHETLRLHDSREVEIDICNMGFMPLYGVNIKQKILALFSPEDRYKAVGLYLLGQWWSAEDILKTADPSRTGLLKVGTPGERIVLYVLNRIIYRTKENSSGDVPFLCHEEHEIAKILWKDGEAIGFYSVKPEGSLCSSFLTQCYQLPVMDTIFVRKCHRGKGYGLQMLEDFVSSFKRDYLGLKYPLSTAMYKVCKNYLSNYPEDEELLWEVEGTGGPFQRTLIARKLQKMELKGGHQVVGKLNFETDVSDVSDIPMEEVTTKVQKNMEYTVEIVEEVVQIKITKEAQDIPVTTRGRSSQKRKKLGGDTEATTGKIIRVEDIEAGVQSPVEPMPVVVQSVEEADLEKRTVTVTHGEENVLGVTLVHCEEQEELTAEPNESVQEVCALTAPTTVTPEEDLEETELLQMTPIAEIQSMDSIEKTQSVKSFEATTGLVSLQPLEFQQVVEMEIVKKTSGVEDIKETIIEVTEIKEGRGDAEEEMDVISEVAEAKRTNEEITCLQTELDLKPVCLSSEDSSSTETGVLRRSSRISTATVTSQRKFTQGGKVGQQAESAQALDKPEYEKDTEIISEGIRPEQSEIENKEGTSVNFDVDQAEEEDNEAFEEQLKQPDVTGSVDGEFEPAEKGKAEKAEVEKIGESGNVVVDAGEKNNENMETDEALNECAVPSEQEHMERLQEEEHIRDANVVQEKEKETKSQEPSHDDDDEVKSDKRPELIEGDASEKAGKSGSTGRRAKSQSSKGATPLRRSERFVDQYVEGELTRRALRSGAKSVTTISKQRCVQHLKVVKQKEDVLKPHTRVTELEEQKEEKMDIVCITIEGDGENRMDVVEEESKVEKDSELGTSIDHDLNKVENKTEDGSHNETTEAGDEITVMHFDDAKTQVEKETRQMEQMEETSSGTVQKDAGQNVVECTSVCTLQQAAFVLTGLKQIPPEQIGINETTKEISQSQEEAGEEQDQVVSTEEESKEEKEVVKKTDSVVEPAEKIKTGNETFIEKTSLEEDELDTAEVAEEVMRVEDLMTESLESQAAELGADRMLITDSEQEKSMSAGENKDDAVKEITLEEESAVTVSGSTSGVYTNENEASQKEDNEGIRAGNEETIQENSPEEETLLITSRSLRRRTVTIKSTPQRKCFQKTEVEITDNTDKGIIKVAGANKDEKMETEDSDLGEDRVQESTETDEDQVDVVQEEETIKKAEILKPLNEETEHKSHHGEDLDKADNSVSTEKHVATSLSRSQRFKDQPAGDDLTKRVLRSGTKSVTTISKQMHVSHAKAVKQLKESMGGSEAEQKEEVMDTVSVSYEHQDEPLMAVPDSVQEDKVEKENLEPETADEHVLNETENKMEDSVQNETTRDGQGLAGMDLEISDIVKDTAEGKTTEQPFGEPVEEEDEEPTTEMAQKDNVVQSTSVFILQEAAVVPVDCNKASPQKTDDSDNDETLLSLDRQECKEEGGVENQTEYLVEQTEKEQTCGSETSTETGQKEDGLKEAKVAEKDDPFTEMGVEEPIKENLNKQDFEMGTDNMPETNTNEEKSMSAEEQVITFEEESGKTADMYISESEIKKKGEQLGTLGLPEEDASVITSRTLRRRTVTVKSPPQQKSKRAQKTGLETAELENVKMAEVVDIMDTGISEEKGENKDEKAQDSAMDITDDQIQKPCVTNQGQMEVVQEEPVKDNSTPQSMLGSEESTIKEVIVSRPADESEVSDNNFAEVEKDAEIEDKAQEPPASEPVEMQVEEAAIEVPGEGEQTAEETTEVVKLQKASVVLVDINKVSLQVSTEDTLQPQEKECKEPEKPADVSVHMDESKAEQEVMKQTDIQVEATEVQEKELLKETTNVQETELSEADSKLKQCDNEKADIRTPKRHSSQPVDQFAVSELSTRVLRSCTKQAIASPSQRHTRHTKAKMQIEEIEQTADEPEEKRELDLQADIAEGDKRETENVATEGAAPNLTSTLECRLEESKVENDELRAEIIEDSEGKEEVTHPQDENTVDDDIRTEQCSESDQVTTEDVVLDEAAGATTENKASDNVSAIPEDAEIEAEGSIALSVKEQAAILVSETAGKEEGQNAVESTLGFTLQNAAVVLVDFNKVHPKITSDNENTEETSQSQEEVDKQVNTGEDKTESNEDEEMEQTESLVETEKEQTDENRIETASQEKEGLDSTVLEEKDAFAVTNKGESMTEVIEETPMDEDADSTLKTSCEQEESVMAEDKGKDDQAGNITLEEESVATVSDKVESVQEGLSEEETPIITSRSLRRRTITVKSSVQIKSKQVPKSSVQEEMKKTELDKETDVNKAEKPSVCISLDSEISSEDGKMTSEMEKQEPISEQQEVEALVAEEIPDAGLKLSEVMADEGNSLINESEDKEKGEIPPDTAATIEVGDKGEESILEVKSTENTENTDGELVSLVQDNAAQEKELEVPTGSPTNEVEEGITESEERELEKSEEENSAQTNLSKPAQENTEEEASDEEEELKFTKNLRRRTVTVQTLLRRKHKHLSKEVLETCTEKPQPEKGELSGEPSNERKPVEGSEEPITAVEAKKETMIPEMDLKDESGDAQVSSEEMSKEIVTVDKLEDKNPTETDGEMVENIADQEKEEMDERTETIINEKRDGKITVEDTVENNLEKEPDEADKVETVGANPEQENVQQQSVLDVTEEQLLEQTSGGECRISEEEEKEEMGNMSTTEEILEVEGEVGVTRRSLRKRTITIKTTPERKSKRLRKQDQDVDLAEDPLPGEEPVESLAENQATETQATSQEQCDSDSKKEMLSEISQEHKNPEDEETRPEKEEAQLQELINVSTEETGTKIEAQNSDKGEVEEENIAEADACKEGAAEHENESTGKDDKPPKTVEEVEEKQDNAKPNEKNGKECSEISLALNEGFSLELDEEDENSGPEKNNSMKETEASLTEHPVVASTSIQNTDRYEEHITDQEEQPSVKKKHVPQKSSASPDQRRTRRSERFPRESQSEAEDMSEAEASLEENEEKKISQQKRKAIVDLTPRRSKRLARPKMV